MLKAGDILRGRYRIERHIKKGGMGSVYEALDHNLGNKVAIKYTDTINNKFNELTIKKLRLAFEREARLLSRLRHPNLPIAIDYFEEDNRQYLVMDYIEGEDLQQQLENKGTPFSVEQVVQWADSLLDTLTYLHRQQKPLIHRDIKPANLKLTASGKMMLLDFGLAKGGLPEESGGTIVYGKTLGYSPPEQIALNTTNERSDLYALSATLYYLLTAKRPIDAKLRQEAAENNVRDPLKLANQLNPKVPAALAKVLASAMALEPNKRPASARQMQAMIKYYVDLSQIYPVGPSRFSNYVVKVMFLFSFLALSLTCVTSSSVVAVFERQTVSSLTPVSSSEVEQPITPTIQASQTAVVTSTLTNTPLAPATITIPISVTVTRRPTLTSVTTAPISILTEVEPTRAAIELPSSPTSVKPTPIPTITATISPPPRIKQPDSDTNTPPPTDMPPPAPTSTPTDMPPPAPTNTSAPPPTNTSAPPPTNTSAPAPTNTSAPAPTNTSAPPPTNTSAPPPTNTSAPPPTKTPTLMPSNTPTLIPSNTPITPSNTPTLIPTSTPTLSPSNTPTLIPTSTPTIAQVAENLSRVSLGSPANEAGFNQGSEITFQWAWDGNLAGNAAPTYRLSILKFGTVEQSFDTSQTSYTWQSNLVPEGYEWNVVVINASVPAQTKSEWNNKFQINGGGGGTPEAKATIPR